MAVAATLFMVLAVVIGFLQERVYSKSGAEGGTASSTEDPAKKDGESTDGENKDEGGAEKSEGGAEKSEDAPKKPEDSGN